VPVRPRACEGDDPACRQGFEWVAVEHFDACVDLEGKAFESVIVRPARDSAGAWPAGPLPVAVFTHGASQDPGDYYDLLEHVAANGVVIAAFDATPGRDVTFRANRLLSYLECLRQDWSGSDAGHLSDRYALVGHSRGGSAVAVAAQAIADGLAGDGIEVVAVVALAPANASEFPLPITATPSYFTLQGSRDPDTQGASLGWFDEAGVGAPEFVRALTWVFGATHQRFHQGLLAAGTGELEASLSAEGHWAVARAYVGGFIVWRLLEHDAYRPYFTGAATPASLAQLWAEPGLFAGLTDGTLGRLVVHDFEAAALSPSTLGAAVEISGFTDATVGPLAELDAPWSGAHQGVGARLDWSAGATPSLRFELPPESQDLSGFAAISLRVARVFDGGEACGSADPVDGLTLVLSDGLIEVELPLTAAQPDRFAPETFGNWVTPTCHAQDFLLPKRVGLAAACEAGLELTSVTSIELRVAANEGGAVLIDDLSLERGEGEAAGCP
jgi:hypothetical protein